MSVTVPTNPYRLPIVETDPKRISHAAHIYVSLPRASSLFLSLSVSFCYSRIESSPFKRQVGPHRTTRTLLYRDRARYRVYTGSFVTLAIGRVTTSVRARDHAGTRSPSLAYTCMCVYIHMYTCTLLERNENKQARVITKPDEGGGVTNKRVTTKPTLFTFTVFVYAVRLLHAQRYAHGNPIF